jgi:hypothetical protein
MPYIGKSPTGSGVRTRYYFTATGGETSLSGADDGGKTLTFSDGEYVDVYLNGIALVAGTDYGTATANTISGLAALSTDDIVEVVVYDIYNVAKINSEAVRTRHYYTATGGETSIGTAQIPGLSFPGGTEIEVSLNGISLVAGTDYNTTAANTVGGLSALSAGNVIEIIIYDKFQLADTVSKAQGGTFSGPVTASGGLNVGTIKEATGTNTGISISSAGIITKPQTPAFRVTASAGQSLPNATLTKISFDTKTGSNFQFDTGGDYDTTNYHFLAPVTGVYFFKGQFFASVSTNRGGTFILVDTGSGFDVSDTDTYLTQGLRTPSAANGGIVFSSTAVVHLTAGHKVAAYAYQEQGSASTINSTGSLTHFTGYLVG